MKLVEILGGDLHSIALDRDGRVHSTGSGLHGALGRGGLASTGEELDFQEVHWWMVEDFLGVIFWMQRKMPKLEKG